MRTPLHSISLYSESIASLISGRTEALELLEKLNLCAQTASRLTEDVLVFSSANEGMLQLNEEPFQIRRALQLSLDIARQKL